MPDIKISRDDLVQAILEDKAFQEALAQGIALDIAAAAHDAMLLYIGLSHVLLTLDGESH